ncbi:hypothetical protein T11_16708 [Trichinella zimbabwensis]|uniref:Uncharacterized protein n=1 Tax=Trichinella zimbabwensis TaxID=268475 RepID=A0A0V1GN81_9BILA|nr:hypothetical protein T11_16708 [Trichinella zimbabwensis]
MWYLLGKYLQKCKSHFALMSIVKYSTSTNYKSHDVNFYHKQRHILLFSTLTHEPLRLEFETASFNVGRLHIGMLNK